MTGSGDLGFIAPSEEQKRASAIFQLNQGTPRDVGNGTQLDRVIAAGDGIIFHFTMTQLSNSEIDKTDFHDFMYETARPQICSNPSLVEFFDTEAEFIEYRVSDRNGAEITENRFSGLDCE